MLEQALTPDSTPELPRKPRRPAIRAEYDPRSVTVSVRHLPLVIGASSTSVWRWRKAGTFPQPRRLSLGRIVWLRTDLDAWLSARPKVGR